MKVYEVDYLWRALGEKYDSAEQGKWIESDPRLLDREVGFGLSTQVSGWTMLVATFSDFSCFLECLGGLQSQNRDSEPTVQTHDLYERYSVVALSRQSIESILDELKDYEMLVVYELLQPPSVNLLSSGYAFELVELLIKLTERDTVLVWGDVTFMQFKRGETAVKWQS